MSKVEEKLAAALVTLQVQMIKLSLLINELKRDHA